MYTSKIALLVFIFLAVWFSLVNFCKLVGKEKISALNFILQAIGIVGIIAYSL